jgi:hypothetical protein
MRITAVQSRADNPGCPSGHWPRDSNRLTDSDLGQRRRIRPSRAEVKAMASPGRIIDHHDLQVEIDGRDGAGDVDLRGVAVAALARTLDASIMDGRQVPLTVPEPDLGAIGGYNPPHTPPHPLYQQLFRTGDSGLKSEHNKGGDTDLPEPEQDNYP